MAIASSFAANTLIRSNHTKLPFHHIQQCKFGEFKNGQLNLQASSRIYKNNLTISTVRTSFKHTASRGRDNWQLRTDEVLPQDSFFLSLLKEILWGIRSLFVFLIEQPSQLRYIEWPSFQNTLRTAMLTLILVAMLIVALSSVDSALSYLLAVLLRRTP